jgi:acyl carrier protein
MDDIQARLLACFQAVFPEQDEKAMVGLSQAMHSGWDSLASVTLVRLVEEQFGVQMDLFDLEELDSFAAMEKYIRNSQAGGPSDDA